MRYVSTLDLTPSAISALGSTEALHIYNGLDCMLTLEIFERLAEEIDPTAQRTYEFSKSLQGPILEMNLRGLRVDQHRRSFLIQDFTSKSDRLKAQLAYLLREAFSILDFNPRSPAQVGRLLYDVMGLPPVKKRTQKGTYEPSTNRDALEKLQDNFHASVIIAHILGIRDLDKKIGVLKTGVDSDGRLRTSFNIGGTVTGRLSSSFNEFGAGTNLQNIEELLRSIFIADEGMKFANIDLEQGDSRNVGAILWTLYKDETYLNACESGDLHTSVARMSQPGLGWTGDLATDQIIAKRPFYRQHSLRHMCKMLGHGTNYMGTPSTMSQHTKIPRDVIVPFQAQYFRAFPKIPPWHEWVARELVTKGFLTTPFFERRRYFFGRRDDKATIREAVAFMGQSMTADEINTGLVKVFRLGLVQLLLQVHDSILIQYPEDREAEILPRVLDAIVVPVDLPGRRMIVPVDCKVGWNWSNYSDSNPNGLRKFSGHDERTRIASVGTDILDRGLL